MENNIKTLRIGRDTLSLFIGDMFLGYISHTNVYFEKSTLKTYKIQSDKLIEFFKPKIGVIKENKTYNMNFAKKRYKLLKDLPQCPAGRIFAENIVGQFRHELTEDESISLNYKEYFFTKEVIEDTEWFEPYNESNEKL